MHLGQTSMQGRTVPRLQFLFFSMEFGSLSQEAAFCYTKFLGKSYVPQKVINLSEGQLKAPDN